MLNSSEIPKREPVIDVGVILPTDRKNRLRISIPESATYRLDSGEEKRSLSSGDDIAFEYLDGRLHVQSIENNQGFDRFIIQPEENNIEPQQGIRIHNVPAGRGFHWQKEIDVIVPGSLIVRPMENGLILINQLPLEYYLMCVATSEMSACCPASLIEAQTIAARSWLLANVEQKHRHWGMDVCNDDCCQRYQGTTFLEQSAIEGAQKTHGLVLMFDKRVCDARYAKSCGGMSEAYEAIWPGRPLPYLLAKPDMIPEKIGEDSLDLSDEQTFLEQLANPSPSFCDPYHVPEDQLSGYLGSVDEGRQYFRWKFRITQEALTDHLQKIINPEIGKVLGLVPVRRGASGRINKLKLILLSADNKKFSHILTSEYQVRQALHPSFLYSSAVAISDLPGKHGIPSAFEYLGAGWGHGAGLCQIGALGMALKGYDYPGILRHYYPGTELVQLY